MLLLPRAAISAWSWEAVPTAGAQVSYESNPNNIEDQSVREKDDAYITTMSLNVKFNGVSRRSRAQFEPQIRLRESYANDTSQQLDGTDFLLPVLWSITGTRSQTSVNAGYTELPSRDSDYQVTDPNQPLPPGGVGCQVDLRGRCSIDETQSRWYIGPNFSYNLSQRMLVGLSGQYSSTSYNEAEITGRFDYDYLYGTASLTRVLSPEQQISLSLNASQYTANQPSSNLENDTTSVGFQVSYDYLLGSKTSLNASAGTSYSDLKVSGISAIGGLPCYNPNSGELVLCETRSNDTNFVGSLFLRQKLDQTITGQVGISRELQPNSDGAQVVSDTINAFIQRDLSTRLLATAGASYNMQQAVGARSEGVLRQRFDRDYARLDLSLSWRLTAQWTVRGQYSYYQDKQDTSAGSAASSLDSSNHIVSLQVRFNGLGFR